MNKATETTRVNVDDRLVLDDLTVLRDGAAIEMTAEQQVAEPARADVGTDIDPNQFATIHRGSDASFEVAAAAEDADAFEFAMAHAPIRTAPGEVAAAAAPAPLAEDERQSAAEPGAREPVMAPEWIVTPEGEIEDIDPAPQDIDQGDGEPAQAPDTETPVRQAEAAGEIAAATAAPAADTEEALLNTLGTALNSAAVEAVAETVVEPIGAEPEVVDPVIDQEPATEPETGTETEATGDDSGAGEAPAEPDPEPEPEPEIATGEDEPPVEEPDAPEDTGSSASRQGRHGDDWIDGTDGDDRLDGHFGDDRLFGGAGDDRLEGRHGDDTLIGGRGDDEMRGGHGDDLFIFGQDDIEGGGWHDEIDGGHGHDVIDLSGVEMGWALNLDDKRGGSRRHDFDDDEVHSGTIHFDNGAEIEFDNVETIVW
jgi:hypothetical protein